MVFEEAAQWTWGPGDDVGTGDFVVEEPSRPSRPWSPPLGQWRRTRLHQPPRQALRQAPLLQHRLGSMRHQLQVGPQPAPKLQAVHPRLPATSSSRLRPRPSTTTILMLTTTTTPHCGSGASTTCLAKHPRRGWHLATWRSDSSWPATPSQPHSTRQCGMSAGACPCSTR